MAHAALREIGIGVIAIMPNDTARYREDSFDNMKVGRAHHTRGDEVSITQNVARLAIECDGGWYDMIRKTRACLLRPPGGTTTG